MASIPGIGSNIPSLFDSLISNATAQASRPITLLNNQKSSLQATLTLYNDVNGRLTDLKTAIDAFTADGSSVFGTKKTAVTNGDSLSGDVLRITAGADASVGDYAVTVSNLARAQSVRSDTQLYADQALGLSGTFVIGGAAARAVSNAQPLAGTVSAFGTSATLVANQSELSSGTYYVETRQNPTSSTWQFRVVNSDGQAVNIANQAGGSTTMTSDWQSMPSAGGVIDTGRGLTFTLDATGGWQAGSRGTTAASVAYTAKGATITVTASDTLKTIVASINKASIVAGNEAAASVVNNHLVLTSESTGTGHTIAVADTSGSVLQSLGILTGAGAFKNVLQAAEDATFSVNGISVTRQSNSGLTDVISGATIELVAEGRSASVNIQTDRDAVKAKIQLLLSKFNTMQSYLKTQAGTTASGTTFKRGGLAGDVVFARLRSALFSAFSSVASAMPAGAPASMREIGVTLDPNLTATISEASALEAALAGNYKDVEALFDAISTRLAGVIAPYLATDTGVIASRISTTHKRMKSIDQRVASLGDLVKRREATLRKQYSDLLSQVSTMSAQAQNVNAMLGGSINISA